MAERRLTRALRGRKGWLPLLLCAALLFSTACATPPPAAVASPPASTVESKVVWAVTPAVAGATPDFATRTATATPQPSPTRQATARATSPAAVTPGPAFGAEILKQAAAVRELQPRTSVPTSLLSRPQLRAYLSEELAEEEMQRDLARDQGFFIALGLLPEKAQLAQLWLDLLDEQIVGMYSTESHDMKLIGVGAQLSLTDEMTLAHEYVHALQDQTFATSERIKQIQDDGDRATAYQALVEGDATLASAGYMVKYKTPQQLAQLRQQAGTYSQDKLLASPAVLQLSLTFPYEQGLLFVTNLFRGGGWAAVNRAYANPPQSSEQILHPEKYLAGEAPQKVRLPDLAKTLGGSWALLGSDTFGELGWQAYLLDRGSEKAAKVAAAGWGGDRYAVLGNGDKYAVAALTVWDSENEAREFALAVRDRYNFGVGAKVVDQDSRHFNWTETTGGGLVAWQGARVLLAVGPDLATAQKLAAAFLGL
ncbi:MAG: hypothetical protein M1401_06725 [Chloroflexi bacterium]|nr:hypothetical protein [Chloroflexota bacterium]